MKKKRNLASLGAALGVSLGALLIGASAHADNSYLRGELGGGLGDKYETNAGEAKLDDSWRLGGAFGTHLSPNVRLEAELAHSKADIQNTGSDSKSTTAFGNVYYDFAANSYFTPFVGAGVGWGKFETNAGEDDGVAYQGIVGVSKSISDRLSADVTYRYVAAPDLNLGGVDADYSSSFVGAGLTYKLGG